MGWPVSIGFQRGRLVERNGGRQYTQVTLDELSVLDHGDKPVYEGAVIVSVVPAPDLAARGACVPLTSCDDDEEFAAACARLRGGGRRPMTDDIARLTGGCVSQAKARLTARALSPVQRRR